MKYGSRDHKKRDAQHNLHVLLRSFAGNRIARIITAGGIAHTRDFGSYLWQRYIIFGTDKSALEEKREKHKREGEGKHGARYILLAFVVIYWGEEGRREEVLS